MNGTPGYSALLFIGPGCPHCAAMITTLTNLVKAGDLAAVEIVNAASDPDRAAAFGIRSVPWIKLDFIELQGAHSAAEITQWLTELRSGDAIKSYIQHGMQASQFESLLQWLQINENFLALLAVLKSESLDMKIKLGIGALMESLQGSAVLHNNVDALAAMLETAESNTQADILYYLSLTHNSKAIPWVRQYADSPHPSVAETARDALEELAPYAG